MTETPMKTMTVNVCIYAYVILFICLFYVAEVRRISFVIKEEKEEEDRVTKEEQKKIKEEQNEIDNYLKQNRK